MDRVANSYHMAGYGQKQIGFGQRPAIVVVDFQNAFLDEQYPLGRSARIRQAAERSMALLAAARDKSIPVFHTVVAFREDMGDGPNWKIDLGWITPDSHAAQVSSIIQLQENEPVIIKKGPSAFFGTALVSMLAKNNIDTVIVIGCVTSGCIRATVIDSFSYGFRTIVPEECAGDHTEEQHNANMLDVNNRYADVLPVEKVIHYLQTL